MIEPPAVATLTFKFPGKENRFAAVEMTLTFTHGKMDNISYCGASAISADTYDHMARLIQENRHRFDK